MCDFLRPVDVLAGTSDGSSGCSIVIEGRRPGYGRRFGVFGIGTSGRGCRTNVSGRRQSVLCMMVWRRGSMRMMGMPVGCRSIGGMIAPERFICSGGLVCSGI